MCPPFVTLADGTPTPNQLVPTFPLGREPQQQDVHRLILRWD